MSYFCTRFSSEKARMRNCKLSFEEQRDVAQSGSATVWGTGGRKFESCHPDKKYETSRAFLLCLFRIERSYLASLERSAKQCESCHPDKKW